MTAHLASLLVSCRDRKGTVASLAQVLYGHGANILDADQRVLVYAARPSGSTYLTGRPDRGKSAIKFGTPRPTPAAPASFLATRRTGRSVDVMRQALLSELLPAPSETPTVPGLPSLARHRLARGSVAPPIRVRVLPPPASWSQIVPLSIASGQPMFARDRRPVAAGVRDRAGVAVVALLTAAAGGLAVLLVL